MTAEGKEVELKESLLMPTGGELPYVLELQTGRVLDILLGVLNTPKTRAQVNDWLYRNTKPNFSFQPNAFLHLAYSDQRDGHGTTHWWRLSYGDDLKSKIDSILKESALTTITKQIPSNQANSGVRAPYEWGGMYFRSKVEMKIAEQLDKKGILFFANARGRYSLDGSPVSAQLLNGRFEIDFLIFHQGKCVILQIDGPQHKKQRERDYATDRILIREGIPTMRFTDKECREKPAEVINEVLQVFGV